MTSTDLHEHDRHTHPHDGHTALSPAMALSRRTILKGAFGAAGAAAFTLMAADAVSAAPPTDGGTPPTDGGVPGGDSTLTEFVGITTDGTVVPDLFSIHGTGVSTAGVVTAATAYLASLSDDQRTASIYSIPPDSVETDEFRLWSNVDGYTRQGVDLAAMTSGQRTLALAILEEALSARGLAIATTIRQLNTVAGEVASATERFNEYLYYFTFLGTPSTTDPWGFQFEGHHLAMNYFVLGDQVVMTPSFYGTEPRVAVEGTSYPGLSGFDEELAAAIVYINTLTAEQQAIAIISSDKTGDNNVAEAFGDNTVVSNQGILVTDLSADQQTGLFDLVALFIHEDDGHAALRREEIESYVAETYFSWVGGVAEDSVFYFRVQSPVVLLQFDCQLPGPIGQATGVSGVTRNHIHSIIRTPNGNDYGKDLLAQHLAVDHGGTNASILTGPTTGTYGSTVTLTGSTGVANAVELWSAVAGTVSFALTRTTTADADGAFSFTVTASADTSYYTQVGDTVSGTITVLIATTVDGDQTQSTSSRSALILTGTAAPGSTVILTFTSDTAALAPVTATTNTAGSWTTTVTPTATQTFIATGSNGTTSASYTLTVITSTDSSIFRRLAEAGADLSPSLLAGAGTLLAGIRMRIGHFWKS